MAGVVGVSAPTIAAISAHYRQVRQQEHERRLKEQELRQQERIKDIEELRGVLDEALQRARALHAAGLDALAQMVDTGDGGGEQDRTGPPDVLGLTDAVGLAGSRVVIRLGRNHPVTRRYNAVRDSLGELRDVLEDVATDSAAWQHKETRHRLDGALTSAGSAIREYVDAANAYVGVAEGSESGAAIS